MTTAIVCIAVLAALLFALGANVTGMRAKRGREGGTQVPTDPADPLLVAIRAHGNAAEYIPTLLVLFLLLGAQSPDWWVQAIMIAATAARLVHAFEMLRSPSLAKHTPGRMVGASGTYLFGLGLAVAAALSV